MRNSKRLLKDLPFDNIKKNTVFRKTNQGFIIDNGTTWYNGVIDSGSHNGYQTFNDEPTVIDILKTIWDNDEWFEPVTISPVKYKHTNKSITLYFDNPLDIHDLESIAKGIRKTLVDHYKQTVKNMGWTDERTNITF